MFMLTVLKFPRLICVTATLTESFLFYFLAVKVRCSHFWFYAKIKPTLFQNLYMNPDEAFLGDDCPVTYISPDAHYELFYYSNKCGIITKVRNGSFKSECCMVPSAALKPEVIKFLSIIWLD